MNLFITYCSLLSAQLLTAVTGLEVTPNQYLFIIYKLYVLSMGTYCITGLALTSSLSIFSTVTHCSHWASNAVQSIFSLQIDAHLDSTSTALTVLVESHT